MAIPLQEPVAAPRTLPRGRVTPQLVERLLRHVTVAGGERGERGERGELEIRAPFDGSLLATIPRGMRDDVLEAVARARDAQADWATCSVRERVRIVERFHDLLLARHEEGLDLAQLESGKARMHAFEEIVDIANVARYYGARAASLLRPRRRRGLVPFLTAVTEYRHPIGTVGFVIPWNYPLLLTITDAIPALVAGNAVVLKPDAQTTLTSLWVVDLLYDAGLPRDVATVVTGDGAEIGPDLVGAVDFVMFTGSSRTGRIVGRQAAERLIGFSLELGGKNPMLVLGDADVERAAEGAVRACFVGAGQVCVSIERIYVARAIADRFVDRFVARTRALRLGATLDYGADVGSLTMPRQLERVEQHVRDAIAKGARVLAGGKPRPDIGPLFYEPTILAGVTHEMECFGEETFGPVVAIHVVDDVEEAIALANATPYGLNASLWTRDEREALRVATRIEAGSVNVNEGYGAAWGSVDAPIGGFKQSGHGRRHGRDGLLKYTETQVVAVQRLLPLTKPPSLEANGFARFIARVLRLQRRIPGLR